MGAGRTLSLFTSNSTSQVSLADPSQSDISDDNLLAYIPRFQDDHNSELAGIFVNIEGVFPCAAALVDLDISSGMPELSI